MHRVAQALGKAGFSAEEFCDQPVQEKPDSKFPGVCLVTVLLHNIENFPVKYTFNPFLQFLFRQFLDGRKTLCKYFTVAAVAAENKVFRAKAERFPDCCRFFSDVEVCRSCVHVLYTVEILLGTYREQHILEFADIPHIAPDCQQIFLCESSAFKLLFCGFFIRKNRDIFEMDIGFTKNLLRIIKLFLRHFLFSPYNFAAKMASRIASAQVGCGKT